MNLIKMQINTYTILITSWENKSIKTYRSFGIYNVLYYDIVHNMFMI